MGFAYAAVTIGKGLGSFAPRAIYDRLGSYAWLYMGSGLSAWRRCCWRSPSHAPAPQATLPRACPPWPEASDFR